ncbi:DUF4386 domain-containing protein [Jiulongibacter sediminis]|uniref:DUF4386 domain-containing protein n=1 Tax=Jiulongibacter sediminis TaxID=1605367 RepID=A0A0P7BPQ4_9BACT|nr:DUF4386 domain-containing protein [Jiulongibacter sediminis]KPM47219.1 hypothetical protein AFM12_15570 [Jiulongibacter sediminis]TBX22778.1 hypothetical protein TK44_15580 [Jiulongibacter sediminis]
MKNLKKDARIAGLWYLFMGITGMLGLMYVPGQIYIAGNSSQTAQNILNQEGLFRFGILANLLCQTSFLFLALAFQKLFDGVSDYWSKLLKTLVTAAVPIAFFNALLLIAALLVLKENGLEQNQKEALSNLFIQINSFGTMAVQVFWGLWLLPLGMLFIRAEFMPKLIGYFLIAGCVAYLFESLMGVMNAPFKETVTPYLMLPLSLGEFSAIFWLLIKGVKKGY